MASKKHLLSHAVITYRQWIKLLEALEKAYERNEALVDLVDWPSAWSIQAAKDKPSTYIKSMVSFMADLNSYAKSGKIVLKKKETGSSPSN